jgi:integrase
MNVIDEYLSYLSDVRRVSPHTLRLRSTYMGQLTADIQLLEATTTQLQTWIARPDREWAPRTINAVTATVRSFYRWASETGRIEGNPAAPLRTVSVPERRPRMASPAQIDAGLSSKRLEVRAMTLLGAECGLRVHEIAKLQRREREEEWLIIIGKGGRQRTVHMSPELRTVLDALEAKHPDSPWYFASRNGGHVTTETLRVWSRRELGTNPHSLRHRAGTSVYRGTGNNLRVTQVFLGHRYPATTAIYVHVEREDLLQAGEAARLAA